MRIGRAASAIVSEWLERPTISILEPGARVTRLKVGDDLPFYKPQGNEVTLFEYAWNHRLPMLIKGPTGCGKTLLARAVDLRSDTQP